MTMKGQALAETKLPKKAVPQDFIYASIKERIINCEIPPGGLIVENEFAEEFGTSRTPIREALLRLQRDRLVQIFPRRGTFTTQISLKEVDEIFDIRLMIEPQIIQQVISTIDLSKVQEFKDQFSDPELASVSYKKWFFLDRRFHEFLVESTENDTLIRTYLEIMDKLLRVRIMIGKLPTRAETTNDEHIRILDAILARDDKKAAEYMREHIIASREAAFKLDRI